MKRIDLVALRNSVVTPDTAEAIRQVEIRAGALGDVRLIYEGTQAADCAWAAVQRTPGPTECPPPLSMRPTGREVRLRLQFKEFSGTPDLRRRREIEVLWGLAVPCGLIPWMRYPLPGKGDDVFHYLGPWQGLYDSLCGEGRGDLAWPSLCCAAQVDVGKWEGDRIVERFVQAQLHRLGIPCGAVDGIVSERTTEALRALGIKGMRLDEAAAYLATLNPPKAAQEERRHGYVVVPDRPVSVVTNGKIAAVRTPQGYALTIDGPGRVVLDVGESS